MPYSFASLKVFTQRKFVPDGNAFFEKGDFASLSPFGNLEVTCGVHLGLIGKHVLDFLLVIIELFFVRCYG